MTRPRGQELIDTVPASRGICIASGIPSGSIECNQVVDGLPSLLC